MSGKGTGMFARRLALGAVAAAMLFGCGTTSGSRRAETATPPVATAPVQAPMQTGSGTTPAPVAGEPVVPPVTAAETQAPVQASEQPQAPAAPPVDPKIAAAFAEGVKAFQAGKVDDAVDAFEDVLDRDADHVSARYNLAFIEEHKGNTAEARKRYEALLEKHPDHVSSLLNLGRLYRMAGEVDRAMALYEDALKRPELSREVALLNNLVVVYRVAKQYPKAEATARRALASSKHSADAYKNLALVYYDMGQYRLAELLGAEALKLQDKDPGIYNNLGLTHLKMGDRTRALAYFKKAIELDPQFALGHLNIGAMALAYRDYDTAERELTLAAQQDPGSLEAQLYLAYVLDGLKGRDPAKGLAAGAAFEKVLATRAELPEAVCGAGWAYSSDKLGWDKAISYLEKCKGLPGVAEKDVKASDAKLAALIAMKKEESLRPPEPAADAQPAPEDAPAQSAEGAPTPATEAAQAPAADGSAVQATVETPASQAPQTAPAAEGETAPANPPAVGGSGSTGDVVAPGEGAGGASGGATQRPQENAVP